MTTNLSEMDKKEARVLIAKDVLAALKTKHIKAREGAWLVEDGTFLSPVHAEDIEYDRGLREVLRDTNCEACALGAIFVAAVERYNEVSCNDARLHMNWGHLPSPRTPGSFLGGGFESLTNYLSGFFEPEQLRLIEIAFERGTGAHAPNDDDDVNEIAAAMMFESPIGAAPAEDRMIQIMQNIIDNDGTFVVPQINEERAAEMYYEWRYIHDMDPVEPDDDE